MVITKRDIVIQTQLKMIANHLLQSKMNEVWYIGLLSKNLSLFWMEHYFEKLFCALNVFSYHTALKN